MVLIVALILLIVGYLFVDTRPALALILGAAGLVLGAMSIADTVRRWRSKQ